MSKLNISPNLFLEVNELNKLTEFIEDGYKPILKQLVKKRNGIIKNDDNTYFKVSPKEGFQNIVIINAGIAFDSNLNRILLNDDIELEIPDRNTHWIVISYDTTNYEEGLVNISSQGVLSGFNTKFTSVLRGQLNFPTKIKFNSPLNNDEYEVVDVTSDTEATLVGSFVSEKKMKYKVIGAFTPGFQPDDEDKAIYTYDSCKIQIIESEDVPELIEGQYVLAKISYINDNINITDERTRNLFDNEVDNDSETNYLQNNPFVSLTQTTIRSDRMLDIQFEWGYKISKFEIITSKNNDILNIISGNSNFISGNNIPDGIFEGWLLVNLTNMVSVVIENNISNSLYITNSNPFLLSNEEDNKFVIVPNAKEIEIEVTLNKIKKITQSSEISNETKKMSVIDKNILIGTLDKIDKITSYLDTDDYGDSKYFFKFSIENAFSRFNIPLDYGQTSVKLRYRMLYLNKTTKFQKFANTQFINIQNNKETLGDSSFIIIVNKIVETKNYS